MGRTCMHHSVHLNAFISQHAIPCLHFYLTYYHRGWRIVVNNGTEPCRYENQQFGENQTSENI